MSVLGIIAGVLLIIACVVVIICVTVMESKSGLGTIAGEGNNFFDQNRGRTQQEMLKRFAWIAGAVLGVLTFVVLLLV